MYKQVETHKTARYNEHVEIHPVATLEDEYGGRAHIWIDDHCYQLGIEAAEGNNKTTICPMTHIFPEAFLVLKTLPDLVPA